MFKFGKYWIILVPLVFLVLITGKAAYGYWVEQVQADWELTFAREATVLITGLELPEIPLAPLPLPEEIELTPIEEEVYEEDADVLQQENEPTPDADAGQEGPTAGAGSDAGDIPTDETKTNAGADETEVTEQEEPTQETDIVPEEQAPVIDDLTEYNPTDAGNSEENPLQDAAADNNENPIPGADGATDNVENSSAPVDSSGEDSGNNGSASVESSGENGDD